MDVSRDLWTGVTTLLRSRHVDVDELLAERERGRSEQTVALADLERLQSAVRTSVDPAFGLELGASGPIHTLGMLGELMTHAPTVRVAFEQFNNYLPLLLLPKARFALTEAGGLARFGYEPPFSERRAARYCTEFALSYWSRAVRELAPRHAPLELTVRHPRPHYAARYETVFGCPVRFGAARNELVFAHDVLDANTPFFDYELWMLLKRRADERLVQVRSLECLADRVRYYLRSGIDLSQVTPHLVAHHLQLTPRRLRVRLRAEEQTLATLVDEARRELALMHLSERDTPIKNISAMVGFSEVSTFNRAFRRWTGTTPGRYRDQREARPRQGRRVRAIQSFALNAAH